VKKQVRAKRREEERETKREEAKGREDPEEKRLGEV